MTVSRPSIESPFLHAEEAANYLRLSERTLEYYRTNGGGPPYRKHGHRIVYHRGELDAWSLGRKYHSTGGGNGFSPQRGAE